MTSWEALVLGVVQGATEFLPVSSSGHLVLGQALMDLEIPGVVFEVAVHVATLVSVLFVYRRKAGELITGALRGEREAWRYLGFLVAATIPAAAVGILFEDRVEALFERPPVVGGAFLVTGALLWSSRAALRRDPDRSPGLAAALLIGAAQALALIPGISRSGTTVVAGLWLGIEAEEAAEFSFLMAVPAIAGAAVLQVPRVVESGMGVGTGPLLWGSVAAALTGMLAIWTFVGMLRRKAFHWFAPYVWALGIGLLGWLYLW